MFSQAVDGIQGIGDDLEGDELMDSGSGFKDCEDFAGLVGLGVSWRTEGYVPVIVWAKVYSAATAGIRFAIVEAGTICVCGYWVGIVSYSRGVVALGWDKGESLWD